jgi:molybdopterin-guanine dinucleotide biosynthesis protein A
MPYNVSGVILAGGKSSRFGTNKAFIEIGGKKIISRQIELFGELFREIIIVCKNSSEYSGLPCKVIEDIVDYTSPLSGIYTGLKSCRFESIFVVACDMPFLKKELIEYQLRFADDFDVVVPQHEGDYEALHALYSKSCTPLIEEMFKNSNFRVYDFYNSVKLKIIDYKEIKKFDPDMLSFANINTMDDLEKVKRIK